MSSVPLRSPKEVAQDFVMSWDAVAEKYLYEDDEIRTLVRERPETAEQILQGTDKTSKILEESDGRYFSIDDTFGIKIESHESTDSDGKRIRIHNMLSNPSLFDRAISGRTVSGEKDQLNSKLGWTSSGIIGGVLNTLLLFLALIPVTSAIDVDLVGTELGGGVLLGCVAVAMFGSELWHRFVSYERPYTQTRDNEHYESGVGVAKWYLGCLVVGLLLYLFFLTRGESVVGIFSGGLLIFVARLVLGLTVLAAAVLMGFLLFTSPGFGSWPAAYRESGERDAPIASPVQFFFVAPLFLAIWGSLGGSFYPVAGISPFSLGVIGLLVYPLTGALVARLLRH